jgi:soluble lytic murein transglycosylase-like protein
VNPELSLAGKERRRFGAALLVGRVLGSAGPLTLGLPHDAHAGAQVEEPLANSVRSALAASVNDAAPPTAAFDNIEARLAYLRWLGEMSNRLKKRKAEHVARVEFLETAWYESKRAGLEPSLLLGLIQVESGFRKYAISSAGARGYTQVMPFWARLIGNGDPRHLFHMQTNLRFGCVILRHYLDLERGDLYLALGRYNGSRGRPDYPNAVFASQRAWAWQPG